MKDNVFWHKGLAYDTRPALQGPGFLSECENINLEIDGDQTMRMSFAALNSAALDPVTVHSVRRFESYVIVGHGGTLSAAPISTGTFVTLGTGFTSGARWRWREYKNFLHGVNGYEEVLFDESGNLYPAEILNPDPPATSTSAAGTLLAEKFMCYNSFYITFPNGAIYETGLSDGKEVDCSAGSKSVSWAGIPTGTYAAYYAATADAFNKTLTLLHFNGGQDSTTITDSTGRHTWTVAGTAKIDNTWDTLGTNSLYLDGDSDYVPSADSADWSTTLAAAAFTAHFMVKFTALPTAGNSMGFFGQADATNAFYAYIKNNGGSYELHLYVNSAATVHHYHGVWTTPVVDTEYHIAFIRGWGGVANTEAAWKITVDGAALTSVFDTSAPTVTIPDIGGAFEVGRARSDASTVVGYVNGYMKEFVLMNVAKWTAAFTVPTTFQVDCSIRRKLYRGPSTGSTLGDIYYVATLYDNTTTTYADDNSAATLAANGASYVDDYAPGPHSEFLDYHYWRLTLIDKSKPWRLWYSEAAAGETAYENENLALLAFTADSYDDIRVSGYDKTSPMGLLSWGTNYFLALKHTWVRRQGNDPSTWSWKKTFATHGVCAKDTISLSKQGVIYLSTNEGRECGLAVFNGQTSELITSPKLDYIFNTDLDPDHASEAYGTCVGQYYHLLYLSTDTDWKWLAVDLRRLPEVRASYWTTVVASGSYATCLDAYNQGYDETNSMSLLVGGSDGVVYYDAPGTAVPFDIETKDLAGPLEIMNDEKTLKEIRYNLDSQNEDVTLELYIDAAVATWQDGNTYRTISGTEDRIQVLRDMPPNFKGRFFRLKVYDDTGHLNVHIYSPWTLVYDPKA